MTKKAVINILRRHQVESVPWALAVNQELCPPKRTAPGIPALKINLVGKVVAQSLARTRLRQKQMEN
jgi:hypothetical protein